jgi:tetratricopeptide (TPR) repeat protein
VRTRAAKLKELLERTEKHLANRDYPKALESCEEAIKFAPESALPLYLRGLINSGVDDVERQFEADERYKSAVKDFDAALKIYPKHAPSLAVRGIVHLALKDTTKAKADIEAAEKLDAKLDLVYLARAQLMMNEDADSAKVQEQLTKAIELRAAASDLDKALELNPSHRQAKDNRAKLRQLGY